MYDTTTQYNFMPRKMDYELQCTFGGEGGKTISGLRGIFEYLLEGKSNRKCI